jgi:hypothetical protein
VDELDAGDDPLGRVRRPGGGRKKAADLDPGLRPALLALVEPDERGDPMSPLRWTVKSTRTPAAELTRQGHRVSADTVGDLLREEGFSLQAGAKTIEGKQHPGLGDGGDVALEAAAPQWREAVGGGEGDLSARAKEEDVSGGGQVLDGTDAHRHAEGTAGTPQVCFMTVACLSRSGGRGPRSRGRRAANRRSFRW